MEPWKIYILHIWWTFSNANQMCLVPEWNQMIKITQIKKQIEILSGKIKLNKKWKQFSGVSKVND